MRGHVWLAGSGSGLAQEATRDGRRRLRGGSAHRRAAAHHHLRHQAADRGAGQVVVGDEQFAAQAGGDGAAGRRGAEKARSWSAADVAAVALAQPPPLTSRLVSACSNRNATPQKGARTNLAGAGAAASRTSTRHASSAVRDAMAGVWPSLVSSGQGQGRAVGRVRGWKAWKSAGRQGGEGYMPGAAEDHPKAARSAPLGKPRRPRSRWQISRQRSPSHASACPLTGRV